MKLANSIWELPDYFDQESFFGATDEEWMKLIRKEDYYLMVYNVVEWVYGENEQKLVIYHNGEVHTEEEN